LLATRARLNTISDLLRRTSLREPGKTAIVYRDLRQSYADLDAMLSRTAGALAARGVGPGDRVAIFSHNNHAFVVCYFALARLGAVSVPVNFMLAASEVGYVLEHSEATGLIAEDALVPVAEQAKPRRVEIQANGSDASQVGTTTSDEQSSGAAAARDGEMASASS